MALGARSTEAQWSALMLGAKELLSSWVAWHGTRGAMQVLTGALAGALGYQAGACTDMTQGHNTGCRLGPGLWRLGQGRGLGRSNGFGW